MNIGAIAFKPYIFNTNSISSASMNKVSGISNGVLNKKIDYSELVSSGENENPLKKGMSTNFMDILASQMEMSKSNESKIMKPVVIGDQDITSSGSSLYQMAQATQAYEMSMNM